MNSSRKSILILILLLVATTFIQAQVGVGTTSPAASAQLDVSSTTKGFLPPRMTVTQRNAISSPATGLIIFNTTSNALNIYFSGAWFQLSSSAIAGSIATLVTASPTDNGTLEPGTAASGVSSVVSYTGGNGENHSGQTVNSTNVTGLTATLSAGTFAVGNGTLTYSISGTPSTAGTASFALNIGGQTSTLTRLVTAPTVTIGQSYQGGIVAYILQNGDPGYDVNIQHGFIITSNYYRIGGTRITAEWGCVNSSISGADATVIGSGNQNTSDIIAGCNSAGIAAKLCADWVEGGYSDWYLPSKDELWKIFQNRATNGITSLDAFWSSSEFSSGDAWVVEFNAQALQTVYKGYNNYSVLPIRAF